MNGRGRIVRAAFLFWAAVVPPAFGIREPALRNLLSNPSFEPAEGSGDRTNPPDWTRWTEPGSSGRFTWDNRGGRKSGDRSTPYSVLVEDSGLRTGWVSTVPIVVDDRKAYLLAGFVSVNRSAGEARIVVRFSGPDGYLGEAWTPAVSGSTGPGSEDWVWVAARVVPPEGATSAVVVCRGDHFVGAAWFDDVGFYELGDRLPDIDDAKAAAFAALGARLPRGEDERAAFATAFRAEDAKAAARVEELRAGGKLWEPGAVSLNRARRLEGTGLADLDAGWKRRGWEHLRDSAAGFGRVAAVAERGAGRPDPLAGASPGWPFPFGFSLNYRAPVDTGALNRQLGLLGRFGVRDIQIDMPWGLWEPEAGRFDFAVPDAVVASAGAAGQKLYVVAGPKYGWIGGRMPGSKSSLMGFNPWYMDAHPESALASSAGESIHGCDGLFWDFAFLDPAGLPAEPAYLSVWKASLGALGARFAGKPGFGGWLLSHEPRLGAGPDSLRNLGKPGLLGHNPEYVALFRVWLREKYGTYPELKAAWGKAAPRSFEKAEPPGPAAIRAAEEPAAGRYRGSEAWIADWLLFRADALARGIGWEARVLDQFPPASSTLVVAAPKIAGLGLNGPIDPDGLAADALGAAGSGPLALDLQPDAIPFPLLTRGQDVSLGAARAAGDARPIWLTDYGFHSGGVLGGDERQDAFAVPYAAPYMASAVLSGVRGFFLKGWSEKPGPASLILAPRQGSTPGTISDEGLAALEIGGALTTVGPWLASARTAAPRYGLLVSWPTILFDDPAADHPLAVLNALALAGIHDVAIVTERDFLAGSVAVEVLFAPHVTRLSPACVDALRGYVAGGGVLVADTYLASLGEAGKPRRPLSDGLDALFGLTVDSPSGTAWSDERTGGLFDLPSFKERSPAMSVSLSWYSGSFRVHAAPETEVLASYYGGEPGKEVPAITVRQAGRGKAAIFPRFRIWPDNLTSLRNFHVPRPELRELRMGRSLHHINGLFCAMNLKGLLDHMGVLPPARLARAPVSTAYLDEQGSLAGYAGVSATEFERSRGIVRATQTGLPHLGRNEIDAVRDKFGVDPDAMAPVRVGLLESPGPASADAAMAGAALGAVQARLGRVVFKPGKAELDPKSEPALDEVAAIMARNPGISVEVRGHTDNTGGADWNVRVSLARAAAVARYLAERRSVDPARLSATGFGGAQPVASNRTEAGRAANRRVEFAVVPTQDWRGVSPSGETPGVASTRASAETPGVAATRGKLVIVASFSSWGRDAEVIVPPASVAVDLQNGEEFPVADGRVRMPLGPYQTRLLALLP